LEIIQIGVLVHCCACRLTNSQHGLLRWNNAIAKLQCHRQIAMPSPNCNAIAKLLSENRVKLPNDVGKSGKKFAWQFQLPHRKFEKSDLDLLTPLNAFDCPAKMNSDFSLAHLMAIEKAALDLHHDQPSQPKDFDWLPWHAEFEDTLKFYSNGIAQEHARLARVACLNGSCAVQWIRSNRVQFLDTRPTTASTAATSRGSVR